MARKKPDLSQFTDEEIQREAARRRRANQTTPPRAKILRPCPKGCGEKFGVREMRVHIPQCQGKKK